MPNTIQMRRSATASNPHHQGEARVVDVGDAWWQDVVRPRLPVTPRVAFQAVRREQHELAAAARHAGQGR